MKKILTILLLAVSLNGLATKIYIAPTGNDATGNGSISTPYFTIIKAWSVVSAGDTIYCRGGTYEYNDDQLMYNKDGNANAYYNVWAYPGERPIFTRADGGFGTAFQPVGLLKVSGSDYVYLKDLEITGFPQDTSLSGICSGLAVYQSNNCIIERVKSHHNGHGILVYESGNTQILYCDTHHNYDPIDPTSGSNPYGDGDGLEVTDMGQGTETIIRGHRSWNNADDGIDLWDSQKMVTVDGCWSWKNGYREDGVTTGGDGNGIKLGRLGSGISSPTTHLRTVSNCVTFNNRCAGFNHNLTFCIIHLLHNIAINEAYGFYLWENGTAVNRVKNNVNYNSTNPPAFKATDDLSNNSFLYTGSTNTAYTITSADFVSLDTTGVSGARQSDGKLPVLNFARLVSGSDLKDAGVSVGVATDAGGTTRGYLPDIGAYEYEDIKLPTLNGAVIVIGGVLQTIRK